MKNQLTQADFILDEAGTYYLPGCLYEVIDQLHGVDCGKAIPSLLLMATDGEGTWIDAGLFHSWDDVLAVLNHSILLDNYTTAAVAVYDTPSEDATQRAADLETFATLRRELDRLTPLSQFMPEPTTSPATMYATFENNQFRGFATAPVAGLENIALTAYQTKRVESKRIVHGYKPDTFELWALKTDNGVKLTK